MTLPGDKPLTESDINEFYREQFIPGPDLEPWAVDANRVLGQICAIARQAVALSEFGPVTNEELGEPDRIRSVLERARDRRFSNEAVGIAFRAATVANGTACTADSQSARTAEGHSDLAGLIERLDRRQYDGGDGFGPSRPVPDEDCREAARLLRRLDAATTAYGNEVQRGAELAEELRKYEDSTMASAELDIKVCDGHAAAWFTGRNHLKGEHDCIVCACMGITKEQREQPLEIVVTEGKP